MKIALVGAPSCRKSTTAEYLNVQLKQAKINSSVCPEVARNYILRYGQISDPWEQLVIFNEQVRLENELTAVHDVVVCDSSSWIGYIYCDMLMGPSPTSKVFNLKQTLYRSVYEQLKSYDYTFFMPIQEPVFNDGVRKQTDDDRANIENRIEGFMKLEAIPYYIVSGTVQEKAIAVAKAIGFGAVVE